MSETASLHEKVSGLGSIPPARRRWRRTLRVGLFWIALGLGAATITYALTLDMAARSLGFDRRFAELFFGLIPIPPLALGVHGLALSLRLRAASALADRTATYLTPVDAVVVFTSAHIADVASSSVPALEGLPAIVDRLIDTPREVIRAAV